MASPSTAADFLSLVRKSGLLSESTLEQFVDRDDLPSEPFACAEALVKARVLTAFQAKQLLAGRHRGLVLGAYKILRPLGKGGMGVVYLAEQARLGRQVAIKVLTQDQAREELALERFCREARAAAALDHNNIVRLYDITQVGGIHFLVMEYVEGVDLHSLIQQAGPMHYAPAAGYIAQAAAGLQHAHEKGFIHRDIKPANLILAKDGTVKILDMGLARSVVNPSDELTSQIDGETISGTVDYLSPEQALNLPLDGRSDIYNLGATFFALVAGRPPFNGSTTQKLTQLQMAQTPNLTKLQPKVPPDLSAVVMRMMAKQPGERFQSAAEVIEALSPWLSTGAASVAVGAASTTVSGGRTVRTRGKTGSDDSETSDAARKKWAMIAGGCLALVIGLVGLWAAFGRGKKPTDSAQNPPVNSQPPPQQSAPQRPAPQVVSPNEPAPYRLNLSGIKPFVQSHTGRNEKPGIAPPGAPAGWRTHSWQPDTTHEFIAEQRNGRMTLGMRFTNGPANGGRPEGMLAVGGIGVLPNREYIVRFEYQTSSQFVNSEIRVLSPTQRKVGQLTSTNREWRSESFRFRNGSTDNVQVEFHFYGPVGEENVLYIRDLELIDAERSQ